ncbi:exodeoxyribonuclease VII large subunit [bacterium]|nr:exodeoxyribonuclease VII large subunit [bacterium]
MPDFPPWEDILSTEKPKPISVSELTRTIRRLLEVEIGEVEVEGEIGSWTMSSRGHAYFTLKDDTALLSCVMFGGQRSRLDFVPEEGMVVAARGRVSVYEQRGQYQLIVQSLTETGRGDLYRRFLEMKEALEKEGLFSPERKRLLPFFPHRIAIVTSPTGAALRDIIHVIRRRCPNVELLVVPTLVQGREAPSLIVSAIERINRYHQACLEADTEGIDVLILARGGGSLEDLWSFNEEKVARAVAASKIPVISGVGHETDFTIVDFVADFRAPTPSAAAEIVVGEIAVLQEQVARLSQALVRRLQQIAQNRRLEWRRLQGSWGLRQPLALVRQATQQLDDLSSRAEKSLIRRIENSRNRLENLLGRLDALNPSAVLSRGYSIVSRARDGKVVTRETQVRLADHLRIQLLQGELRAAVIPRGDDFLDGLDGTVFHGPKISNEKSREN